MVSLMHVNNEIGTVLDLEREGIICNEHQVLFHLDTVQSVGKVRIDLQAVHANFIVASAHKFHGPKGVGFAFIRKNLITTSFMVASKKKGYVQEQRLYIKLQEWPRPVSISHDNLEQDREHISSLRSVSNSTIRSRICWL
jgi:cysteine desulfurase